MRETRKLTDRAIKPLKPRGKPYKAADGDGLYIEVTPAGGKLWRLKYRFGGKEKRLSFGPWPDITVEAARAKATEARAMLRAGTDPARGHRAARGGTDGETMGALADAWAQKQAWAAGTEKRERHLMALWTPKLGDIPARALTPADIRPVVLGIEAEGHHEFARRTLAQIGRVLRHAVALGHADRDVAADLGDVLAPIQSEKYATLTRPAEIAELMKAICTYGGDPSTVYCLRILPHVFTRPGELRNARWPEFDLDGPEPLWRVPAARMKTRHEHVVPLSTQVAGLLRELRMITGGNPHGLLFPGLVAGKPISDATLGQALRRLGYGPDRIVPHGFRAMASTALNEQGHPPDIIELQLAHRDSSVRAIYNRSTRLPERRQMMQSWSDYLDALRTGANVVPFRRPGGA